MCNDISSWYKLKLNGKSREWNETKANEWKGNNRNKQEERTQIAINQGGRGETEKNKRNGKQTDKHSTEEKKKKKHQLWKETKQNANILEL